MKGDGNIFFHLQNYYQYVVTIFYRALKTRGFYEIVFSLVLCYELVLGITCAVDTYGTYLQAGKHLNSASCNEDRQANERYNLDVGCERALELRRPQYLMNECWVCIWKYQIFFHSYWTIGISVLLCFLYIYKIHITSVQSKAIVAGFKEFSKVMSNKQELDLHAKEL